MGAVFYGTGSLRANNILRFVFDERVRIIIFAVLLLSVVGRSWSRVFAESGHQTLGLWSVRLKVGLYRV